ncbi:unnamed protein product [Brassica rapa subsp. trilocularis]|uniref:(rape) hypothetical protein n=1 Tax=Brassica napus TaxID=3708 RepID=A0A816X375_BRANA|nr:unnamed protein product [Brassica napus]
MLGMWPPESSWLQLQIKKKLDRSNNDLIDFNPNSWLYISILIHGFNRGRGELRLGRVSGELTSRECDEIDGERDEIDG